MSRTKGLSLAIAAALAAMAIGFIAGRSGTPDTAEGAAAAPAEREILYYRNPMGLADTSPVPKKDSMGMDYVPVYAGDAPPSAPGTVVMSPDRVQSLGVRTEAVQSGPLLIQVRTSGTIEVDETRQYAIAPRFEGWVERLHANQSGMRVRAGQPLLSVYSPQLSAAQQEYRLADETTRKLAETDPAGAASMARLRDAARTRLRNWEIQDVQLGRSGSGSTHNMVLTSPVDGVVVEKNIVQGARFEPGETVLRLADLSTVWLVAKVPAAQAANITVGQTARFESVALPGDTFNGEVTFVQPVLDAQSRTVDVRVALPNPDGLLRPGLFGTVQLQDPSAQPVLTVPRSAVLDSGLRQIVLVQDGPGRFAPREVTLGRRGGDRVEVLDGLEAGEDVVVSANFLIDAESNLQAALQSMTGHGDHDVVPVEGHDAHGEHDHGAMDDSHLNGDHEMQGPEGHPDHEGHEGHIDHIDHIDHGDHEDHTDHTDHADHADHGSPGGHGSHDDHSDHGEH